MSNKDILVLGSIAYDYIMDFGGDLNKNLTSDPEKKVFNLAVMPHSKKINFGGTSGNISYNIAQLDSPVQVITSVGKDFIDLGYQKHMERFPSLIFRGNIHSDLFTASCYIVNDENHNQMIIFHEGAMKKCPEINLKKKNITNSGIKIASVSPDNVMAMMGWAKELKSLEIPFIFDPGQVTPAFSKEMLEEVIPLAYMLIGNEFEVNMILEKLNMSIEDLLKINSRVIITKGNKGSDCFFDEEIIHVGICKPSKVLDTTGAGDAFRAGLLVGIANDCSILEACQMGATLSSFSVETLGPQTQNYTSSSAKARYEQNFQKKYPL
ncbi:Nucleoside kinase [Candidatus Lokiarchaeum ossiferum]|uniref:Nucleoside kinase n=1 Tax=Candidatus Lokiarchaeum ossiferum TaxID=2951803 RepID=A0ABY6HSI6_9ARCH|nr:Nucleoside kinase [Candidatus Lokiarchaeum sp. B-35]